MSEFMLGRASYNELACVHPDLVRVVERAIELTTQDFTVYDGIRTIEQQQQFVASGASKTMNSRHLPGKDGKGHAVDLVPLLNGKLRWEWPLLYPIAEAMRSAAKELGVPLNWGGLRGLHGFGRLDTTNDPVATMHSGWDGPHFELPYALYP